MARLHVKQSVMDALKAIGLNLYERKLWVALLSKGVATAGELADLSNVPRSRCYDVLESLADKGFVIIQPSKPMRYVAIKPKDALENAKKRLQEKAQEMIRRIENLQRSEVVKELERIYKEGIKHVKPEDISGALRGRDTFYDRIGELISKAKKEVTMITTEQGLKELYEKYARALQRASKAGVDIRILAPVNEENLGIAKELAKFARIRSVAPGHPITRACVVDGEHFLIGLTDDSETKPGEEIAFWARSEHVASDFFAPIFEKLWKEAKEVK